jgi:hypothetical protein
MNYKATICILIIFFTSIELSMTGCNKQSNTTPFQVASLNVVNTLNNSAPLILLQRSISPVIGHFTNIDPLSYAATAVLTPMSGSETVYAIQDNADTSLAGSKGAGFVFNGTLNFKAGSIYSLFITGDTSNPDFLFVQDQLPQIKDSSMGIRFVNLSAGSSPVSINLEGGPNGSEVASLAYKGITSFKPYSNNSTTTDYLFVVRDAATGDSLTQFDFLASGSSNGGNGLTDPSNSSNNGTLLTFRHITVAIYGSESINTNNPLNTMVTDNY